MNFPIWVYVATSIFLIPFVLNTADVLIHCPKNEPWWIGALLVFVSLLFAGFPIAFYLVGCPAFQFACIFLAYPAVVMLGACALAFKQWLDKRWTRRRQDAFGEGIKFAILSHQEQQKEKDAETKRQIKSLHQDYCDLFTENIKWTFLYCKVREKLAEHIDWSLIEVFEEEINSEANQCYAKKEVSYE